MAQPVPLRAPVEATARARFPVGLAEARAIAPECDLQAAVKVIVPECDLLVVVKVIVPECDLLVVAKVTVPECDLLVVAKVTDLEIAHPAVAIVRATVIDQESATQTVLLYDLQSHVPPANVRLDNARQAGAPQAIGHQVGDHLRIVRPSHARPTGTRGIDRGIDRRVTGGDLSQQQP